MALELFVSAEKTARGELVEREAMMFANLQRLPYRKITTRAVRNKVLRSNSGEALHT
jgi:hypothetical protein